MKVLRYYRWARLLKQQSSITVYRLQTKENKRPFSVSACSSKQKFAISVFSLQQTNRSCRFPLVPFSVSGIPETLRHEHGDMEKWIHGSMEKWRHKDMET
jgi:hypothetical protein